MEREQLVESEIGSRWTSVERYTDYEREFKRLADAMLGMSSHERIKQKYFAKTESRLLRRRKLRYPTPEARLRSRVTYTSTKGKNSYSKSVEWNFDQLRHDFYDAKEQRARQSTTQFLRQRERAVMNDRMRM